MTVTLSLRQLLIAMVLAVVLSSAVGFVIASLANPQQAGAAAATASSDREIVRELRRINSSLGANYKRLSLIGYTSDGFADVYRAIAESCRAIAGENRFECPSFVR